MSIEFLSCDAAQWTVKLNLATNLRMDGIAPASFEQLKESLAQITADCPRCEQPAAKREFVTRDRIYWRGAERNRAKQARSLGLNVTLGMLKDAHFENSFFDVIRLSNVVEHLANPKETFREIHRILKPNGIIYLTVPNTRILVFWLFHENWYALDAPRHVISYSPMPSAWAIFFTRRSPRKRLVDE